VSLAIRSPKGICKENHPSDFPKSSKHHPEHSWDHFSWENRFTRGCSSSRNQFSQQINTTSTNNSYDIRLLPWNQIRCQIIPRFKRYNFNVNNYKRQQILLSQSMADFRRYRRIAMCRSYGYWIPHDSQDNRRYNTKRQKKRQGKRKRVKERF